MSCLLTNSSWRFAPSRPAEPAPQRPPSDLPLWPWVCSHSSSAFCGRQTSSLLMLQVCEQPSRIRRASPEKYVYFEMSVATCMRCLTLPSYPCPHEFILSTTFCEIHTIVYLFHCSSHVCNAGFLQSIVYY